MRTWFFYRNILCCLYLLRCCTCLLIIIRLAGIRYGKCSISRIIMSGYRKFRGNRSFTNFKRRCLTVIFNKGTGTCVTHAENTAIFCIIIFFCKIIKCKLTGFCSVNRLPFTTFFSSLPFVISCSVIRSRTGQICLKYSTSTNLYTCVFRISDCDSSHLLRKCRNDKLLTENRFSGDCIPFLSFFISLNRVSIGCIWF